VIVAGAHRYAVGPAALVLPAFAGADESASPVAAIYRVLTGQESAKADIADDHAFDRHVLASILAVALSEPGSLAERSGLSRGDLASLARHFFPQLLELALLPSLDAVEDEEAAMVRDLLLAHRSSDGEVGRWLATLVARRAMEPNHLWEDLGLRERPELTRLLTRHFEPLASANTKNMKWKRFFYRKLCEDDGIVMCSTPVCTRCQDFANCFGDESGESRMAARRREVELRAS
jgi:nitrogen fixation protein NifQ